MLPSKHPGIPEEIHSLLNYLDREYFDRLQKHSEKVVAYIAQLHGGDVHQTTSLYTSNSKKLVDEIAQYIRMCRVILGPYLLELLEKEDSGHDCRACSSSCTIRHTAQIEALQRAHSKIKETLDLIKSVVHPAKQVSMYPESFNNLGKEIQQLDVCLRELFYLEETELIPKVLEVQKAIHAHA